MKFHCVILDTVFLNPWNQWLIPSVPMGISIGKQAESAGAGYLFRNSSVHVQVDKPTLLVYIAASPNLPTEATA